ncbi:hypothetical protein Syun_008300 [Stephania yunnanensis]|uniref:Protein kinase domain-containing protein n=1 Tax=Stephania yunnanensis TaxID=152371 RepID=A0AAP0KCA0_9MAGN
MGLLKWWIHVLFVVSFFGFVVHESCAAFSPVDNYLIACGSSKNVSIQGRDFVPDSKQSSFVFKGDHNVVSSSNSSVPSPIFQSARVFPSTASYEFQINQKGRHWIRLYFYPIADSMHNLRSAPITVVTDNFVLLNNFTFKNYNGSYLFKEYAINVTSDSLSLNFIASNNSVTFVNGIEVVSIPDELFPDQAQDLAPVGPFNGLSGRALETVYRLNMGGPLITPQNDTLGRTWENDEKYLHLNSSAKAVSVNPANIRYPTFVTTEIAPNWVYATAETMGDANVPVVNFNVTWVFPVDPNFMYFVRAHFCDVFSKLLNTLVFNVYINADIALPNFDLSSFTSGLSIPYYKDFVSNSSAGSSYLTVSIGPDALADTPNAILNGLEIIKISNDARSLDGSSSVESVLPEMPSRKSKLGIIIGLVVGFSVAVLLLALIYCCIDIPISRNHGCDQKFDESLVIGVGGFGRVYKGVLEDGTNVAVKRGNPRSEQGLAEFRTEIEMLSKLRHRHLVSLIGYCDERSEMILVYEYMANGPLRSHLYGTQLPSLSWKQRLEICIGAARGLHYLHTGAAQTIIHRDVKTTNILLDENLVAKVADFGLSKAGPALDQTHVSTAVKGSFGYLDPEYFRRQQLTEKSDVYSFGVVLMEVLCSRPALNPVLPREQVNIAEWAMTWQKKGMLDQIMDPYLAGKVSPASLKKFGETAEKCLAEYGVDRPSMGDVLWNLEYALQLEETSSALTEPEDNSTNHIPGIPMAPMQPFDNSVSMIDGVNSSTDDDAEDAATSAVFSQLVNPRGR